MLISGSVNLRYIMDDYEYADISGETVTMAYLKNGAVIKETYTPASPTVININLADCTLGWIKLLTGDHDAPLLPWRHQTELALCQRLRLAFRETYGDYRATHITANEVRYIIPAPVQLRVAPSLIKRYTSMFNVRALNNSTDIDGFTYAFQNLPNSVRVNAAKTAHGLTDAKLTVANVVFDANL